MDSQNDLLKRIANLEHKLEVLVENRVGILEDIEEIKRLQRMYGYYIDLCLWQPMADLFAEKGAAIEIGSRGRYVGKDNVLKFLRDVNGGGVSGLRRLQVINHMQGQGIVTVSPDRTHAQGRWRGVVQAGGGPQRQSIPGSAAASSEIPPQRPPAPPMEALGRQFMPFHYRHPITGAAVTEVVAKDTR